VIVEQSLDSGTVIEVVSKRASPMALDAVVVAAAPAAQADSTRVAERPRDRGQVADSLAAASVAKPAARPLRRLDDLEVEIVGPMPPDSLQKLRRLLQPVKP